MALHPINRLLILPLIFMLTISIAPFSVMDAEESNHIHTRLDQEAPTTIRFNPNTGVEFQVIFYSDNREFDVRANYSAVDSGGEFDLANWEITFDPLDFSVNYQNDVVVTVTIDTNLSTGDKGRSLEITVWGDVDNEETDELITNAQTFTGIIAARDDVTLSVDEDNDMKLVYPSVETRFNVRIKNIGWSANSITLRARIMDPSAANWTVKVIYASFDGVKSDETVIGFVNVTSPDIMKPGDYSLELSADVGDYGGDELNVIARVSLPDLRVKEIISLYNPVLHGVRVQITAVIENNGGYVEDISVRGEVMGHTKKWERLPDAHIEYITNYNESIAVLSWEAEMTDKSNFSENWAIKITVDDLFSIDETNDGNNQAESTIEVRGIEKTTVSFSPAPALMILGIMLVFIAAVVFDKETGKSRE